MSIFEVIFFYIIPFLLIESIALKYRKQFARLYQDRIDPNAAISPQELNDKYKYNSRLFIHDMPQIVKRGYEILWKDYKDDEVNKLARKVSLFFVAQCILMILIYIYGVMRMSNS